VSAPRLRRVAARGRHVNLSPVLDAIGDSAELVAGWVTIVDRNSVSVQARSRWACATEHEALAVGQRIAARLVPAGFRVDAEPALVTQRVDGTMPEWHVEVRMTLRVDASE
jgi:hypothetical protein